MVLHEAHNTLLGSCGDEFAVVLEELNGRLCHQDMQAALYSIESDRIVGA